MTEAITQMLLAGRSDLLWFESSASRLITKYNNQFIAFHNQEILDSAGDLDVLLEHLDKKGINPSAVFIKFVSKIKTIL